MLLGVKLEWGKSSRTGKEGVMTLKKTTPKDSRKKILLAGLLSAALTMATLSPAHAALLSQASQIVSLWGQSGTSGTIPLNTFKIYTPNGSNSTWTFPASGVLVVTEFAFTFVASGTPPPDQVVRVTMGPYEGFNGSSPNMTGGLASSNKAIPTGFVIGPQAWTADNLIKVSALSDPNKTPIPGSLFFSLKGVIYPAPTGGATQASILQSGSQLINLVGTSDASGTVAFNTMQIVQPDGTKVTWSYPASRLLVVTSTAFAFIASGTVPDQTVNLIIGSILPGFDGFTRSMSGGKVNGDKVFPTGWVIGPQAWTGQNTTYVRKNGDATLTPIPGSLIIHLNGYLAPP
jgi:hypothetical protein